jgi:tetrahydromethanopterin S-methyltransferase subunit G
MEGSDVAAITRRLDNLEHRIWGEQKVRRCREPLSRSIAELSTDVGNSLAGHDRITPIIKRLDELEMYLDPVFAETRSQTDRVKQSIVLSQQMEIQNNLDTLHKIKGMSEDISGDKLADVDATTTKLEQLNKIQIHQRKQSDSINRQTLELIERYNTIITSLNQAFVQAEAEVVAAEEKQKRPVHY